MAKNNVFTRPVSGDTLLCSAVWMCEWKQGSDGKRKLCAHTNSSSFPVLHLSSAESEAFHKQWLEWNGIEEPVATADDIKQPVVKISVAYRDVTHITRCAYADFTKQRCAYIITMFCLDIMRDLWGAKGVLSSEATAKISDAFDKFIEWGSAVYSLENNTIKVTIERE